MILNKVKDLVRGKEHTKTKGGRLLSYQKLREIGSHKEKSYIEVNQHVNEQPNKEKTHVKSYKERKRPYTKEYSRRYIPKM